MVGLPFRTLFRIEMGITDLLSCFFFLAFFSIYLTVKSFLIDFDFFFFLFILLRKFSLSPSLLPVLSKAKALSMLYKPGYVR